ncbi:hypothetical protein NBRC10513v2_003386 [Rhodotorula toruloides]|uniref:Uncharacterized protein n=1 Tax=Rhodotorula toruloides TaxID=5286 RepID=A0A0K3CJP6_RHOTO|nr:hypothetical protein AAT19DRAFT_16373 [Rhodotorula toruloides]
MPSLTAIHLPLLGYFALIGALTVAILPNFTSAKRWNRAAVGFVVLAFVSLGVTWTYMFKYFVKSFEDSALRHGLPSSAFTTQAWLSDVSLFQEAWHYVCDGAERWWWSQQLCMWTAGPLTLLLATEGFRFGVKRVWAFMLLGQVVAISTAQSLFFAAVILAALNNPEPTFATLDARTKFYRRINFGVLVGIVFGTASVMFVPNTMNTRAFLPNLLLMHVLILVPLLPPVAAIDKPGHPRLSRLLLNFTLVGLRFRVPNVIELLGTEQAFSLEVLRNDFPALLKAEWDVLRSHPAQSSISWDVIFATVSGLAYVVYSSRSSTLRIRPQERVSPLVLAAMVVTTPLVGVASTASVGIAVREGKREAREDAEEALEKARREQAARAMANLGQAGRVESQKDK